MSESTAAEPLFSLPLVTEAQAVEEQANDSEWQGWSPLGQLPLVADAPEPLEPQGVYATGEPGASATGRGFQTAPPPAYAGGSRNVELLAPAGGPEAAFAAFHFGANAIYLGLKKFSARAEAENFTLEELDEVTAYAHSLTPRRRVFVTINTLIRQDELGELVEAIAALDALGVDAVILQDLGVYHLLRTRFPRLELHASTQLSVHNRAGAETLKRLGFQRVVLARELTFEEVRDVTTTAGVETEVFIHGALCYSYSGLCLFSAQTLGRSGNRGKCAYSCRDAYEVHGAPLELRDGSPVRRDPRQGFPFSMKDLALPDHIPALRAAGVSCFKVEGRKKSPLYVATTTEYYRKLIDGRLGAGERPALEADMQTVFSRPWTHLFAQSHKDKEVADRDTVGHRGAPIGKIEAVVAGHGDEARLRFRTKRPLERHDGLQVDLPILGKPFGFAVDHLWTVAPGRQGARKEVFAAPAGALVEVGLPRDHPALPAEAPVYCSSSQAVKQRYRHDRPKPGLCRIRRPIEITLSLTAEALTATGRLAPDIEVSCRLSGPFAPAKDDGAAMAKAAATTFAKLGQTRLELASFLFQNHTNLFVPVSRLNQLRRDLTAAAENDIERHYSSGVQRIQMEICAASGRNSLVPTLRVGTHVRTLCVPNNKTLSAALNSTAQDAERPDVRSHAERGNEMTAFRWSIKVDRLGFLDAFEDDDYNSVDEIIVDIARDHPAVLERRLDDLASRVGREHIRLALPALTRSWEEKGLRHKIEQLRKAGWTKWEAANLSAWSFLDLDLNGPTPGVDLATDWSVYVINRLAATELLGRGVTRFTLSPEDGLTNIRSLLAEFAEQATLIVYQDTPLFLAESCAYANLIGGCPGKANCQFESMEMESSHGEKVTALDYHCRTIVLNQGPFCLSARLGDVAKAGAVNLRADFIYRPYDPATVRERWRMVRAGRRVPGGHAANFDRGML